MAARKLIERLEKNRNKMFTFLDFDNVPWNNNNAEHAIKKLAAYRELADVYFDTDHYEEFCAEHLAELDERVLEWIKSAHFERLLFDTVRMGYPPHEHDQFLGHFHGLIDLWVRDESARLENAAR